MSGNNKIKFREAEIKYEKIDKYVTDEINKIIAPFVQEGQSIEGMLPSEFIGNGGFGALPRDEFEVRSNAAIGESYNEGATNDDINDANDSIDIDDFFGEHEVQLGSKDIPTTGEAIRGILEQLGREIKLDEVSHTYTETMSDRRLLGVSEVKGKLGYGYGEGKQNELQKANKNYWTTRGTLIHKVLEDYVNGKASSVTSATSVDGTTTIDITPEAARALTKALDVALAKSGINLANCDVYTEFPVKDPRGSLVGTIDLYLVDRVTGDKILLDYKTKDANTGYANYNTPWYLGESQRSGYDLQSAAYTAMLNRNGVPVDRRGCVLLKVDMSNNTIINVTADDTYTESGIDWFDSNFDRTMHMGIDRMFLEVDRMQRDPNGLSPNEFNLEERVKRMVGFIDGRIRQLKSVEKVNGSNVDIENTIKRLNTLRQGLISGSASSVFAAMLQQMHFDTANAQAVLNKAGRGLLGARDLVTISAMVESNTELLQEMRSLMQGTESQVQHMLSAEEHSQFQYDIRVAINDLSGIKAQNDSLVAMYTERKLRKVAKEAGVDQFIESFNWNQTEKDINTLFRHFGSIRHSSDSISKGIHYMVVNQLNKSSYDTYSTGQRIVRAFNKAKATRQLDLTDFMEKIDGKYTGHFLTDFVHSKPIKDYEEFKANLRKKYGLPENGSNDWVQNPKLRQAYNKEVKDWFNQHAERYFSDEYYEAWDNVSPKAKAALGQINATIRAITTKEAYQSAGKFDPALLSPEDKESLNDLGVAKREIASEYDKYGVIKVGDDLAIAKEWSQFNAKISQLMKTKANTEAFNAARESYAKDHTEEELAQWDNVNSREVVVDETGEDITDEFWYNIEQTKWKTIEDEEVRERYQALARRYAAMRKMYTDPVTGQPTRHVTEFAGGMMKEIQLMMDEMMADYGVTTKEDGAIFKHIAVVIESPAFEAAKAKAKAEGTLKEFLEDNTIEGKPIRIWTKVVPKEGAKITTQDGRTVRMLRERVPSSNWAEDEVDSPLLNPNYGDRSGDRFWKPKRSTYGIDNFPELKAKYDKINSIPEIKELYDLLRATMKDAEAMIPFINRGELSILPQIRKNGFERIKLGSGMLKKLGLGVADAMWQPRVDDTEWRTESIRRGLTGTKGVSLPVWYVNQLEDMDELSEDVVSTVIQFYQMASQYKHMADIKSDVDLVMDRMADREYVGKKRTYKGVQSGVYDQLNK